MNVFSLKNDPSGNGIVCRLILLVGALALCLPLPLPAQPAVSLSLGRGDAELDVIRIAARWPFQKRWFREGNWSVGGHWEAALSYWRNDLHRSACGRTQGENEVGVISVSPVFRLERHRPWWGTVSPFLEAGIGLSWFSDDKIRENGRSDCTKTLDLGSRFQFEDRLGVGVHLGRDQQWEVLLRAIHYSNGNLEAPNAGVNAYMLTLGWDFP